MRVGNGFDVHRLVEGRPLILGGVEIAHDKGLDGHSDGDALTHAITDAILGALGAGDIGQWFPPDDPDYKDADSLVLLAKVVNYLQDQGKRIVNVDSVIICERPKLAGAIGDIRKKLSEVLGMDPVDVSVKAKTAERLGVIGAGEAIAVQCVVLID